MTNLPLSTSERLVQSRERIRLALLELGSRNEKKSPTDAKSFSDSLLNSLKTTPGANLLLSLVHEWWSRQPLRASLTLVYGTAQALLQPVAQRHPMVLVMGAAAAGALIVLTKPWRLISKPALLAGLLPPLVAQIMERLSAIAADGNAKVR